MSRVPMLPDYGGAIGRVNWQNALAEMAQKQALAQQQQAQAKFAPQYFGGQANIEQGIGQQERAGGAFAYPQQQAATQISQANALNAPAQQAATTQQLQGAAQVSQAQGQQAAPQQAATTLNMQQTAQQQRIIAQYLPLIQRAAAAGSIIPALNQVMHNLVAAGASPQMIQTVVNQLTAAAGQVVPNAPKTPINPGGWADTLKTDLNTPRARRLADGSWQTTSGAIYKPDGKGGWSRIK